MTSCTQRAPLNHDGSAKFEPVDNRLHQRALEARMLCCRMSGCAVAAHRGVCDDCRMLAMDDDVSALLAPLDVLKQQLDALRPLPAAVVQRLHENMVVSMTYHSNAIEGNTLTLMETKVVLEGITVGGHLLREHFEAINHRDAILYIEDIVKSREQLSEWQIRNIHRLVLKNIHDEHAGRYRTCRSFPPGAAPRSVAISGAAHTPPDHVFVGERMAQMMRTYDEHGPQWHAVSRALWLHASLVEIHPFIDGNGRTALLLMNFELLKAGFPPVILEVGRRLEYFQALDQAHQGQTLRPFIKMMIPALTQAFTPYLNA